MRPAALPILDWNESEFLLFYVVAFGITLIWSLQRRHRANDRFSHPREQEVSLSDPYEIAYLAGGAARCSQVALVSLVKSGAVEYKRSRLLNGSKLIAIGPAEGDYHDIERILLASILSNGKKGMPPAAVPHLVGPRLSGVESKLAKLGLRPAAGEASGRAFSVSLPLIALMLLGVAKLWIGISRDKPVFFLVVLLVITLIAAIIVSSSIKKLTPAGERLLERMRRMAGERDQPQGDAAQSTLCGVALLGISGIGHDETIAGLDEALKKDISQLGQGASSSPGCGTGCSSGCSSGCSGCGGGCGGCGG